MTNPIEIIKGDHRKIEKLFKEYEDMDEKAYATKEKKVKELSELIKLHSDMEERFFYSRAKEKLSEEDEKMVEEAITEHNVVRRLLEELSVTHPEDLQFDGRVKVLSENITHHVMEEEQELLPKTKSVFGNELLDTIGEEMHTFRVENGLEEQEP